MPLPKSPPMPVEDWSPVDAADRALQVLASLPRSENAVQAICLMYANVLFHSPSRSSAPSTSNSWPRT